MIKKGLVKAKTLRTPPALGTLLLPMRSGAAMLLRQVTLNVAFVCATRRTQATDPSDVAAAAYAISNQASSLR